MLLESLQRAEKLVYGSSFSGSGSHGAENAPNAPWDPSTRPENPNSNPYAGHHAAVLDRVGPASAPAAGASKAKKGKSVARNTFTLTRSSTAVPARGNSATTKRRAAAAPTPNWGANLPSR